LSEESERDELKLDSSMIPHMVDDNGNQLLGEESLFSEHLKDSHFMEITPEVVTGDLLLFMDTEMDVSMDELLLFFPTTLGLTMSLDEIGRMDTDEEPSLTHLSIMPSLNHLLLRALLSMDPTERESRDSEPELFERTLFHLLELLDKPLRLQLRRPSPML